VNVTTPGTPVRLSTDPTVRVSKLQFQGIPGAAGKGYVGSAGLNKSSLAGVARIMGATDFYLVEAQDGADSISLSQFAIDADLAGEGLLVSYWTE
jgi:hypothetical protein